VNGGEGGVWGPPAGFGIGVGKKYSGHPSFLEKAALAVEAKAVMNMKLKPRQKNVRWVEKVGCRWYNAEEGGASEVQRTEDGLTDGDSAMIKHGKLKKRTRPGHTSGQILGHCRYCQVVIERNSRDASKCDGGGAGSILGTAVIVVGALMMMVVSGRGEDSGDKREWKAALRNGGVVMLFLFGNGLEWCVRQLQSSCCCRCAESKRDVSCVFRRTCRLCRLRRINSPSESPTDDPLYDVQQDLPSAGDGVS